MRVKSKGLRSFMTWAAVVAVTGLLAGQAFAAKNVIIMIGDGMGPNQVNAGSYYLTGQAGQLCFEPYYKASVTTTPLGGGVTDSAAAGTALATGNKVYNGTISQSTTGTAYTTILEKAKAMGKQTGLVSTVNIFDATPAAFGAHESSRTNITNIGNDYINGSMPNVIFGGGSSSFSGSQTSAAQHKGYQFVYNNSQMNAMSNSANYAFGLFNSGDMTYEYDRAANSTEPHLNQMATKALSLLEDDPDGFFLMVEGGAIDHACHSSDINRATREVVEFNNSVQAVLNWMQGRDDTVLIVTADHETGGLTSINQGAGKYPTATWTGGGNHTGTNVPFYITGANADLANQYITNGVMDNTSVFKIMDMALVTPVPEPSSLMVGAAGLLYCCAGVRRKISQRK